MYPVAFQPFLYLHLPPTSENTRQLNYLTSRRTIIERTTCKWSSIQKQCSAGIYSAYKNCRFANCRCVEPGYKIDHLSRCTGYRLEIFATKVHKTMTVRSTLMIPTYMQGQGFGCIGVNMIETLAW